MQGKEREREVHQFFFFFFFLKGEGNTKFFLKILIVKLYVPEEGVEVTGMRPHRVSPRVASRKAPGLERAAEYKTGFANLQKKKKKKKKGDENDHQNVYEVKKWREYKCA